MNNVNKSPLQNAISEDSSYDVLSIIKSAKNQFAMALAIGGQVLLSNGCAHAPDANQKYGSVNTAIDFAQGLGMTPEEFNNKYEIKVQQTENGWVLVVRNRASGKVVSVSPTEPANQSETKDNLTATEGKSDAAKSSPEGLPDATFAKLKEVAEKYLGLPYKYGGAGPEDGGFGPSGFTARVFKEAMNIDLPRGSSNQSQVGGEKIPFEELRPGDLILISSDYKKINSVGIYFGSNQMAIASSKGVVIIDLNSWYRKHFSYGKRVIDNPPEDTKATKTTKAEAPKTQSVDSRKIAENLSTDELNGMPKGVMEKWVGVLQKYDGIRWRGGGNGPFYNGTNWPKSKYIDCSGTTVAFMYELSKITGAEDLRIHATRSSNTIAGIGTRIPKAKGENPFVNLKVGDLMIFDTDFNGRSNITHVGVYVGGGKMRHVGIKTGIKTVDLLGSGGYYLKTYLFSRRIISSWKNGRPVVKK